MKRHYLAETFLRDELQRLTCQCRTLKRRAPCHFAQPCLEPCRRLPCPRDVLRWREARAGQSAHPVMALAKRVERRLSAQSHGVETIALTPDSAQGAAAQVRSPADCQPREVCAKSTPPPVQRNLVGTVCLWKARLRRAASIAGEAMRSR